MHELFLNVCIQAKVVASKIALVVNQQLRYIPNESSAENKTGLRRHD